MSPFGSVEVFPEFINGFTTNSYTTECIAKGGLNNTLVWKYLRTGEVLDNSGTLELNNISVLNGGSYECLVTNPAGSDSAFLTLNGEHKECSYSSAE